MYMPSIFGEDLFDEFMRDFPFFDDSDMKKIENEMSRISFVNQEQKRPNQEEKIPKSEEKVKKILKNTHKESKTIKKAKKKVKKSTIVEGQMSIFDL